MTFERLRTAHLYFWLGGGGRARTCNFSKAIEISALPVAYCRGIYKLIVEAACKRSAVLDLDIDQGLLIQEVARGSPAWEAGLRPGQQFVQVGPWRIRVGGDVLTAIDGQAVDSMRTLSELLQPRAIGDSLTLTVQRAG